MSMNSLRAVSPLGSIKNAQSCTLSNRVCMFYPKDEFIAQRLLFHLMEVSFVSLPQIHLPKLLKAMVLYWSLWFQKEPLTHGIFLFHKGSLLWKMFFKVFFLQFYCSDNKDDHFWFPKEHFSEQNRSLCEDFKNLKNLSPL